MISKGLIPDNSKLPSTRELSQLLQVSRNSVVLTYEELKSEGLIYSISGKGTFVKSKNKSSNTTWSLNWDCLENTYSKKATELNIIKSEIPWSSDLISFKSISPDGDLFDMEELKNPF